MSVSWISEWMKREIVMVNSLYSQTPSRFPAGTIWWGPLGFSACRRGVCVWPAQLPHLSAAPQLRRTRAQPGENLLVFGEKKKPDEFGGLKACWWRSDGYLLWDAFWGPTRSFKHSSYAIVATDVHLYATSDGGGGAADSHRLSGATSLCRKVTNQW